MKRFPFPLDADVPLYLAPDGRRVGVAVPAALPPLWRGRRRHRIPVGRGNPPRERSDDQQAALWARRAPDRRPDLRRRSRGDGRGRARSSPTCSQPEFIDINFGCPVKKVVQAQRRLGLPEGSRSRRSRSSAPSRAARRCRSRARSAAAGTRRCATRSTIALRCQDAGVRALALHPRTRTQMYTGQRALGGDRRRRRRARHPGARQRRHQDAAGRDPHAARDRLRGRS